MQFLWNDEGLADAEATVGEEGLVGIADLGPFGGVAVVAFGDAVKGFAGLDNVGARRGRGRGVGGWWWRRRGWRDCWDGGCGSRTGRGFFIADIGDFGAFGRGCFLRRGFGRGEAFVKAFETGDFAFK